MSEKATRDRRITIVDVAEHAGVSAASVSKVLRKAYGTSDAMRVRVQASMDILGYRPHRLAQGMRGRTLTVGMMVSDLENPFFGLLANGLREVLADAGYQLLLAPAGTDRGAQHSTIDALIDHRMDALVLVAPRSSEHDLERIAEQVPVVVVGRHSASARLDSVSADDFAGAGLVVEHLVGLGHRSIAMIANRQTSDDESLPETIRLSGFRAAVEAHDLLDRSVVLDGRWSVDGGHAVTERLLHHPAGPTSVFAGADVVAFGILSELRERDVRVPDTLSVVGYDNSPTSALGPMSLTTVDQSGFAMGSIAGRLLLERIEGRATARHELIIPTLVPRATTGPPRGTTSGGPA
ncbi:MAG TPA: LacI family DNA-binding transcriptional regulator [Pseudolysinimonas sp.]|nr:LacI family DNA-binding transcriptional regulator [Pseudolysinimonas sp.]